MNREQRRSESMKAFQARVDKIINENVPRKDGDLTQLTRLVAEEFQRSGINPGGLIKLTWEGAAVKIGLH